MEKPIKNVGIIGSWRSKEQKDGKRIYHRKDDFPIFCEQMGNFLSDQGFTLVVAWSNDFLNLQVVNKDYYFEETAEYHTLKGYLKNQNAKPIIFLSEKSIKIFKLAIKIFEQKGQLSEDKWQLLLHEMEKKNNTSLQLINSLTGFFSEEDLVLIRDLRDKQEGDFDGLSYLAYLIGRDIGLLSKIVNSDFQRLFIGDNLLRTEITNQHVLKELDFLITIGGGKVTAGALNYAIKNLLPFIPVFSYGGETDDLIFNNKILKSITEIRDLKIQEEYRHKFLEYNKKDWFSQKSDLSSLKDAVAEFTAFELGLTYPTRLENDNIDSVVKFVLAKFIIDMEDYEKIKQNEKKIESLAAKIDSLSNQFDNWKIQLDEYFVEIKTISTSKKDIFEEIVISVGLEHLGNGVTKKIHINTQHFCYADLIAELMQNDVMTQKGKPRIDNFLKQLLTQKENKKALDDAIKSGKEDIFFNP